MATLIDGYGTFIPVIPLPSGWTAGQLATAGLSAPGRADALSGYQVPGEGMTSGGLVTLPPGLQPGYTNQGPLVAANAAVTGWVGTAPAGVGRAIGTTVSGVGTAAQNALPQVKAGGIIALLVVGVGLYVAAQVVR
jgi:hypothetical protein